MLLQWLPDRIYSGLSFKTRLLLLLSLVVSVQLFFIGYIFHITLSNTIQQQVGTRAMVQAREIASDYELIEAVEKDHRRVVQSLIDRLSPFTDADYIVVGNNDEVRLAHPNPSKVGLPMVGGDSSRALKLGESYYSIRKGSLGFAIRGKAPIFSSNNQIVGVISVGYLLDSIDTWFSFYLQPVFFTLLLTLLISFIGAWAFSTHIKRQMYDMEPNEIALSLRLQESVLQAVYEGIIAVDTDGKIVTVNKTGLSILGISYSRKYLIGRLVSEFVTPASFLLCHPTSNNINDEVINLNGETLIASRVAITDSGDHSGWVVSFRRRNDINTLTHQLTQVRQFTENFRVVTHEHANRLSTISGLIQIGAYDQALKTIRSETENQQQLIDYVSHTFNCRIIAGLLLGKYSRAQELGLKLEFETTCLLQAEPVNISSNELAAVIGNLLDNAFEATLKNPNSNKTIVLLITDITDELVVEVSDNGAGIDLEKVHLLFEKGATSKEEEGHGIGLYLVHRFITNAGGVVIVDEAEPLGAIFSLFVPNKR